jgi:hypothetical protein
MLVNRAQIYFLLNLFQEPKKKTQAYNGCPQAGRSGNLRYFVVLQGDQTLGPTKLPTPWVPGSPSPGMKRKGREADHSTLRITGAIPPLPHMFSRRGT